jgi:hypothetical protein
MDKDNNFKELDCIPTAILERHLPVAPGGMRNWNDIHCECGAVCSMAGHWYAHVLEAVEQEENEGE